MLYLKKKKPTGIYFIVVVIEAKDPINIYNNNIRRLRILPKKKKKSANEEKYKRSISKYFLFGCIEVHAGFRGFQVKSQPRVLIHYIHVKIHARGSYTIHKAQGFPWPWLGSRPFFLILKKRKKKKKNFSVLFF